MISWLTIKQWRKKWGLDMGTNTEYSRKRREDMEKAGLGEIRGLVFPKRLHDEIKKKVRREYGNYKVKKGSK